MLLVSTYTMQPMFEGFITCGKVGDLVYIWYVCCMAPHHAAASISLFYNMYKAYLPGCRY